MHNFGYSEDGRPGRVGDLHLWRRILVYCASHRLPLAGAVMLSLLITAAGLMLPKLMQLGIDGSIVVTGLSLEQRLGELGRIVLAYGGLVVVVFLAGFSQIILLEWVGQSIMDRLRQALFAHLLTLDMGFFHRQQTGRLVTRLTNDIQNMHEMFTSVMVTLFNDALKLLGIFCFLFFMNSSLALVMSLFVPLALLTTIRFSRLARGRFRAIRSQLARLNGFLAESLASVNLIQVFNRQAGMVGRYRGQTEEYLQRNLSQIKLFGLFMPLTDLMSATAVALILWCGGGEIIRSRLSLGELVAFLSYMRLFFQPLREVSQKYSIVQSAMASAERIFQLLDTPSAIVAPRESSQVPELKGDLCFEAVWFGYSPDTAVLQGIDLRVRQGETLALIGTTGAGKSTLINLLCRYYDPDQGRIRIGSHPLKTIPLATLRAHIGVIMQDIFILPDTIQANIILDAPLDRGKLAGLLHRTGLEAFIQSLPQGLATLIGEGAKELSVGEKQLLSFVRALYRDPAILILDEATSSIDAESERILEEAMAVGLEGRTSLVIAHRLSTIRRVDRIVVLDQGRVAEQGSHGELMARPSLYRELVNLDLEDNRRSNGADGSLGPRRPQGPAEAP
ncbi:ABC transporter ATP-binding protein [Desulfogranum mediterraneum]|uniref:ABC transporter ATP-binding protein n=1 Tax=Desulfogranum mediterraneum TaxID=160661 RepID=UPI00041292CE|nr:ABC transporter ATP-binding protein [Desulfogranum mediterraneum]